MVGRTSASEKTNCIRRGKSPCVWEQVCKPNSVLRSRSEIEAAIIPLAQPLPAESSDLPEGFGRATLVTPSYLVLHREEFAWPRVSPRAPVRSYIKPMRAAPFHPSPRFKSEISNLKSEMKAVSWFVFCCTCRRPTHHRFEIS